MVCVARWLGRGGALALLLVLTTQQLYAGAWLQAVGKSQIIFSGTWTEANRRFDNTGTPRLSGRFTKQEFSTVFERGLSDTLTVIGGINAKHQAIPTPALHVDGLRLHSAGLAMFAGGRVKLWSNSHSVLSLQGAIQGNGERSLPHSPLKQDAPVETEVRLLAGHSFNLASVPAFVDLQTAYRWRGGLKTNELRFDATLGIRPLPHLLLMLQAFNSATIIQDRQSGSRRAMQHKVQVSAVYDINERWALQGGLFSSIKGRETLRERGILIAVWRKL